MKIIRRGWLGFHSPALRDMQFSGIAEISLFFVIEDGKEFLHYQNGNVVGLFRIKKLKVTPIWEL